MKTDAAIVLGIAAIVCTALVVTKSLEVLWLLFLLALVVV